MRALLVMLISLPQKIICETRRYAEKAFRGLDREIVCRNRDFTQYTICMYKSVIHIQKLKLLNAT